MGGCPSCGKQLPDISRFCSYCGTVIPEAATALADNGRKPLVPRLLLIAGGLLFLPVVLVAVTVVLYLIPGKRGDQFPELAAVVHLRMLNTAESKYLSRYGSFAGSLPQLESNGLIPHDLATGKKGGYTFTLIQTAQGYSATGVPDVYNVTGRRTFFTDQTMVIRQNWSPEPATAASSELK